MSNIKKTLSTKTDANGFSQVMFFVHIGRNFRMRIKSGVFVPSQNWDSKKEEITIPRKVGANIIAELKQIKERLEVAELRTLKLIDIYGTTIEKPFIESTLELLKDYDGTITKDVINKFRGIREEQEAKEAEASKPTYTVFNLVDAFFDDKKFSDVRQRWYRCSFYSMARYQLYCAKILKNAFCWNIDTTSREDINGFFAFIETENVLCQKMPKVFEGVNNIFPYIGKQSTPRIAERGNNRLVTMKRGVKAFWTWLNNNQYTTNNPLVGISIGREIYGTPYYLTIEERNKIIQADFSRTKRLETQRDIFMFQCLIGCRVGDLIKMKPCNVEGDMLIYTPHKTHNHINNTIVKVPLTETAIALIEKYKDVDKRGRLFPFICEQKYNDAIKEILTICDIKRMVSVRNPLSGEEEMKPLNEVASSHMARRTFVGNLYQSVKDPSIIAKMSGHTEGSRAFARYRSIDDNLLREVIKTTNI